MLNPEVLQRYNEIFGPIRTKINVAVMVSIVNLLVGVPLLTLVWAMVFDLPWQSALLGSIAGVLIGGVVGIGVMHLIDLVLYLQRHDGESDE